MTDIKTLVKGNVKFLFARKGELWYETETGFKFPVPFNDMGDGQFNAEDRAMLFMRYIRKYLAEMNNEDVSNVVDIEDVQYLQSRVDEINKIPLVDIIICENAEPIVLTDVLLNNLKFLGLTNFRLLVDEYYKSDDLATPL